jgi:ComF family protein
MVNNWLNIIQNCLFPPTCLLCGRPGYSSRDLCCDCHHDLSRNAVHCPRCASPMEADTPPDCLCGQCIKRLPAFDNVHAPFLFHDAMRYLIHGLKFQRRFENARLLGALFAETIDATTPLPDLLLPVPLHPVRYRERGFNQAIEIAKNVAKPLRIPLQLNVCERSRDTPHQTGLTAKQRRKNLHNAFVLRHPLAVKHVAIIDDVMTSGTTAHEMAKALRKGGATRIEVWTCARA